MPGGSCWQMALHGHREMAGMLSILPKTAGPEPTWHHASKATSPAPQCERPWAQVCSMQCCDKMSSSSLARDSRAGTGHPGTGCIPGTSPRQAAMGHEAVGTPGRRAPGKGQAGMGALLAPRAGQGKVTPSSRWDAQRAQLLASWRRTQWAHCQDFSECHLSAPSPGSRDHLRQSGARQRAPGWEGPALHPGCSQRCPGSSRAQARWAPCSSGHRPSSTEQYLCFRSASDPSDGQLAGVEREKGREGRERASATLAAPRGQDPPPSPTCARTWTCMCAHRHTYMCTWACKHTHVCTWAFVHVHMPLCTQTCTHTHTHTHVLMDLCTHTASLHICVHMHSPCCACMQGACPHTCTHRALVHVCAHAHPTPP